MSPHHPAFDLTAGEIFKLLDPTAPLLPELEAARTNLSPLRSAPQTQKTLVWTEARINGGTPIPQTLYTDYRGFIRTGDRKAYETPYFARRSMLAGMALRLFLGEQAMKDPLQDMIWAICEETTWVLPAHERTFIDLFSAETAFMLGETLALLDNQLDAEVRSRVRFEVERRVFQPYLTSHSALWWYQGHMNWNGVCNSSVAAAFLLLEPEPARVAQGLALALKGLATFIDTGFESDGASNEGVSYWQYGLLNFIALSEMIRARTHGAIDLLDTDQMRQIAAYPARMLLSPARFASFSDCDDILNFNPGIITRLMERTGKRSLTSLLSQPVSSERQWRLTMLLRDILWWDGQYHEEMPQSDSYLPAGGVVRLVSRTPENTPVTLVVKAGHNDENHNQNDVGSFILHIGQETFLADPGRGLYSRQYFGPERYQNIFANSFGHSVPVVGGQLQKEGRAFYGEITRGEMEGGTGQTGGEKWAAVEMARAYPVAELTGLRRQVSLSPAGEFTFQDSFTFTEPLPVEEAFVTWLEVEAEAREAVLHGSEHDMRLTILSPESASFAVHALEAESRINEKPGILKRLSIQLPPASETQLRLRAKIIR